MKIIFYSILLLLIIVSFLPLFKNKHWFFRAWEFVYIQIGVLQTILLLIGFLFIEDKNLFFYAAMGLSLITVIYFIWLLLPFTPMYRWIFPLIQNHGAESNEISVLSVNVYQPNTQYKKLVDLIEETQPDIVLTMESDKKWERGLKNIEKKFPNHVKVPQDNTYGIHFYSHLKIVTSKVNYFTSDDIPSLEIDLETKDKFKFKFFGIHPPPPSPSEEETSKERDGEMMSVAKIIKETDRDEVVVIGDFNNVAWASSSRRFRRISGLIDPRFGRGLISTFHTKYALLRIPIDLMFHGEKILIKELKRLESIESDHFPLFCSFAITRLDVANNHTHADSEDIIQMNQDIQEGINTTGEREDLD